MSHFEGQKEVNIVTPVMPPTPTPTLDRLSIHSLIHLTSQMGLSNEADLREG